MNNCYKFTTKIDSLDIAALLVTLGYELKEVKCVNHIDLNSQSHAPRPISASWHFSTHSSYCPEAGHVEKVIKKYEFPYQGDSTVNVYQIAKIAAHNYQVLKSVILNGEKLQQKEGPNYTVLKNNNGDNIEKEVIYGASCDTASIAIAAALGCKVSSYCIVNDRLYVNMLPSKDGITLKMIEDMKQDQSIANTLNFNTLPVLVAMFINRDILKKEIYEQNKTVLITRGEKIAMINKNASDSIKQRALKFINE
jgi:hypothetical protein